MLEQGRHPAFEIFALILIFLSNLAVLLGLILFKVSEIRFLCLFQIEKFFDFQKANEKTWKGACPEKYIPLSDQQIHCRCYRCHYHCSSYHLPGI